jgi:hypothetical protein
MPSPLRSMRSERGAVLVHVAVAAVGLVAFSAIAIDYGILWMSRRQAQNAADSAALAGAISLAFDSPTDFDRARQSAKKTGELNKIFSATPNINQGSGSGGTASDDISFPTCPPGSPGLPDTCVRVNVYRNQQKDPLPTFFARLLGITSQGVKAMATAQVLTGNATDCLKPWAVADRWQEKVKRVCNNGGPPPCNAGTWQPNQTWDRTQTFDRFANTNGNWGIDPTIAPLEPDVYVPPTLDANGYPIAGTGSGFGLYNANGTIKDYGQLLSMKLAGGSNDVVSSGWFLSLDLPCVSAGCPQNSGASKYEYNIKNCSGVVQQIGDTIPVQTGAMTGPTGQGTYNASGSTADSLYERDPGAYWDTASQTVKGSCAPGICADGRYYAQSPRIVPVVLFDAQQYLSTNPTGTGGSVTITNIFGFFIISQAQAATLNLVPQQGNSSGMVYGVMVAVPGFAQGTSTVPVTSSFLNEVILVR